MIFQRVNKKWYFREEIKSDISERKSKENGGWSKQPRHGVGPGLDTRGNIIFIMFWLANI